MFRQGKCGICGPLMMTEAEFDKTDWVPDPIEQAGKSEVYECFEKSFGQETNEDKMPSLHVPGSTALDAPSVGKLNVGKSRGIVKCTNITCMKPRILYSQTLSCCRLSWWRGGH